ncbi:MAG: pantetheine-phosphate adenylyltransferase [Planctomycetota bacterium]
MTKHKPTTAVFPGTFDPITNGHLDVIKRGARLFDELVVAVGENPEKACLLDHGERAELVRQVLADLPNVRVETYTGLTVDFVRKIGANTILRGIRSGADVQFEFQMAHTNRVAAGVETVFMMTGSEFAFTSSRLIKQIASTGGDVSAMVPPEAVRRIQARLASAQPHQLEQ